MFIVYMIYLFLPNYFFSCRQRLLFLLKIHSDNLHLLIEVLSALTCNVIINMTDLSLTLLLLSHFWFLFFHFLLPAFFWMNF